MKRRSFVKKSVAAAIVAATPMALTGLVNAEGGGGDTTNTETTLVTDTTYFTETTIENSFDDTCSNEEMNDPNGTIPTESHKQDANGKDIECHGCPVVTKTNSIG